MATINSHITRSNGTILTAAIYNTDHQNHVNNANTLNLAKPEGPATTVVGHMATWGDTTGDTLLDADFTGTANTFLADQTIQSNDPSAAEGPSLKLRRNSASPAVADLLGAIAFIGRNSTPADITYAKILADILDPVAATEDGRLLLQTIVAGTLATRGIIGQGLFMGAPTGGDQGIGTINATEYFKNGLREWTEIVKPSDQLVNNSATEVAVTTLTFPIEANSTYQVLFEIFYDTPIAADFKYSVTGPASPTRLYLNLEQQAPDAANVIVGRSVGTTYPTASQILAAANTAGFFKRYGTIQNGVNAGNIGITMAQVTATVGNTTVFLGSNVRYRRIA